MKKLLYITFVSILLVGISSCKKNELPIAHEEEPTVWIGGKVNNIPFKFIAGENASYGYTIAHNIDSQSRQYIFRINAPDLNKSLEISINNSESKLGDVQDDMNKTIKPGMFKFAYSNSFPTLYYRLNEIILVYIDHASKSKFYTVPYNQNLVGAEFEVVAVSDKTYKGKHYKMAEISFKCRVKDHTSGIWYDITDGYGFIPFGE